MPPNNNMYQQAQALVNSQLGALIAQTEGAYQRKGRQGRKFIRGLGKAFARELGAIGMGVENAYDAGDAEMAAMNSAMSNYLSGEGGHLDNALANQVRSIDPPPTVGWPTPRAIGNSLAQQGAAMQSYQMARLNREGVSDQAYAKALPGVAALSTIQHGREFEDRMAGDLEAAIAQIQSQGPGLVNSLYQSFADQALARQQMALDREKFNFEKSQLQAQGGADRERMDGVYREALALAQSLAGGVDEFGRPIPGAQYHQAYRQVNAMYKAAFGGRSEAWRAARTAEVLASAGFRAVSQQGLGQTMQDVVGDMGHLLGALGNGRPVGDHGDPGSPDERQARRRADGYPGGGFGFDDFAALNFPTFSPAYSLYRLGRRVR